ncbi:hypothetical protein FXO37_35479 [Capsicum annuum]|nr:hypothetical protein FXO37_35479 [Capsicum annuum]
MMLHNFDTIEDICQATLEVERELKESSFMVVQPEATKAVHKHSLSLTAKFWNATDALDLMLLNLWHKVKHHNANISVRLNVLKRWALSWLRVMKNRKMESKKNPKCKMKSMEKMCGRKKEIVKCLCKKVVKGREYVVKELLVASPESAEEVTARGETCLHLAVNNH